MIDWFKEAECLRPAYILQKISVENLATLKERATGLSTHYIKVVMSFRFLGRGLLYVLIVLLGCLWTLGCFVVIMTAVCLWGCLENFAKDRVGGPQDLPLICNGINSSWDWSLLGWRKLWTLVERSRPLDEEESTATQVVESPMVTPPPRAVSRPSRNHLGWD